MRSLPRNLSLTPGFSQVCAVNRYAKTVSTVLFVSGETVETVSHFSGTPNTRLKSGVNERRFA